MRNPIKMLSKKEKLLWCTSLVLVLLSNIAAGDINPLQLIAPLFGITAIIFAAKGNVWGQILIAVFCILYGLIAIQYRYWGELITYMGMSFPMAVWSVYTWLKNPSEAKDGEVEIARLSVVKAVVLALLGIAVSIGFYFVLRLFDTPNIIFSTLSVTTSFFAASLTMLRSSYFSLWYALNDAVLIVLWVLASIKNPEYIPVVVNFSVFLVNDAYSFYSWKKRENTR